MTTVILAEKPDQGKKYSKALGQARWDKDCWRVTNSTHGELVIVSSVGHIIHMENPLKQYENWNLNNLPIFPKEFTYRISSGKQKLIR